MAGPKKGLRAYVNLLGYRGTATRQHQAENAQAAAARLIGELQSPEPC